MLSRVKWMIVSHNNVTALIDKEHILRQALISANRIQQYAKKYCCRIFVYHQKCSIVSLCTNTGLGCVLQYMLCQSIFILRFIFFWSFSRLILNSRVCRICGLKTNKKHTNKPHKQTSKKITLLTDICFHQINHDKISIYATTLMKTEVKVKM